MTYLQAVKLGGFVRKGEKATPVVYWKWRTPEELAKLAEKTGQENLAPCVPFVSAVFNLEQTEGITAPADDLKPDSDRRLQAAELMLEVMPDKPEIVHTLIICTVQSRRAEQKALAVAQVARLTAETNAAVAALIKEEQNQSNAVRAATDAHTRFLTKYVNTNITKRAGSQMVAVAVVSETSAMNHAIGTALVNHFKSGQVQLSDSFFKPELVTEGLFARAFNGDTALFNQLELAKSLDALLLARQEVQYETNADLNNVVTVAMQVEVVTLPVAGQIESHSWTFSANGVGIRRAEARIQAEERIIKQIESDKKMSLSIPNP